MYARACAIKLVINLYKSLIMKSIVKDSKPIQPNKYPKLMHDNKKIVLFYNETSGVVVGFVNNNPQLSIMDLGEHNVALDLRDYRSFSGTVELSND